MDRFVRGFVTGFVVAVAKGGIDWLARIVHIVNHTYAEYSYFLLAGHVPAGTSDLIVGQLFELGLGGAIGVVFIYYAYRTRNKKNLWLKGIVLSSAVYFATYMAGTLFRLPLVGTLSTATVIADFATSSIYGALLGYSIYVWGQRRGDWTAKSKVTVPQSIGRRPMRRIKYHDDKGTEEEPGWGRLRKPRKLR